MTFKSSSMSLISSSKSEKSSNSCSLIFSLTSLNELKDKFDDVVTKLQDSDQYSKLKDQVDNVIVQVNDKINEVKEKMSEQEFIF